MDENTSLRSLRYLFKSGRGVHFNAPLTELAYVPGLDPGFSEFESQGAHQIKLLGISVTGSTRAFEVRSSGSIPGSPAKQQETSHANDQRNGLE
jgi:hypothetical protein